MVGKNLSHYKILEELGRGGMGIVYKALDTKLDRTVAIKVLPSAALASDEDRARFYREAKAAAQLHHPHIASVFEIDEAIPEGSKDDDLRPFISMEYIEGETLSERIKKGPLKLEGAVRVASQIASGLEAAHEKDIVHRDLKSQNVMLTKKGEAKILDFGLAQTAASTKLTRMGSTLGTVAYMSPEQARGEEVDQRTDLWSFGVVLYEMIAGRSPFPGDYEQAVVYEILNTDPEPLTAIRTGVPMDLERIVSKLLSKEARHRYQTATDLIVDLETIDYTSTTLSRQSHVAPAALPASQPARAAVSQKRFVKYVWVLPAVLFGMALMWFLQPRKTSEPPVRRFVAIGPDQARGLPPGSSISAADISPDGSALAFAADGRLWVLEFDQLEAREVRGLGRLGFLWTPDSRGLVYRGQTGFEYLLVETGETRLVAESPTYPWSGWQFKDDGDLVTVSEDFVIGPMRAGVEPQRLTGPLGSGELSSLTPLPGDRGFLLNQTDSLGTEWLIHATEEGARRLRVMPDGATFSRASYDGRGYLLYDASDATNVESIWALPIDPVTFDVSGDPRMVAYSARQPTVASDGSLLYTHLPSIDSLEISFINLSTATQRSVHLDLLAGGRHSPEFSPDSRLIALAFHKDGSENVWILDTKTNDYYQLTQDFESIWRPSWSPDGASIVFQSRTSSGAFGIDLYSQSIDGVSQPEAILTGPERTWGPVWSADGRWIVYSRYFPETDHAAIYRIALDGTTGPELVIDDPQSAFFPSFSPDGRFIVYGSLRAEKVEVFVADYPSGTRKTRISRTGGVWPKWRGRHIYWVDTDNNLVRASILTGDDLTPSEPEIVLTRSQLGANPVSISSYRYDVSNDEEWVVVLPPLQRIENARIVLLQNWLASVDFD